MKRWLAVLSIVFAVSFVCSAILAGRVYYQDLRTYSDYDKKELSKDALENIYIKSYVPVDIFSTTGDPYVEFTQSYVDLAGLAPKYELSIEEKGKSTYINLEELQEMILSLGIKENKAKVSIYLPQQAIDRLSIQNTSFFYAYDDIQDINLEGIDVEELDIKLNNAEVTLDGSYNTVNLRIGNGRLTMKSNKAAQLYVSGNVEQNISGKFDKVTIKGNDLPVSIESEVSCNVQIENDDSNITLKGNYSHINISGNGNNMELKSETACKLTTKGYNNYINGNGAFNEITVGEEGSQVELQTTMIPSKVQLGNSYEGTSITLTLPSNIPGFTARYVSNKGHIDQDKSEVYEEYLLDDKDIESDFSLASSISDKGELVYTYGNGEIPITLNQENDITLEIIDGGYSSAK